MFIVASPGVVPTVKCFASASVRETATVFGPDSAVTAPASISMLATIAIVAGSIAGILLLLGALLLPNHLMAGLGIGLIVSLLLAGQFVPKFIQTGKAMPAGMMSILSVIGIIAVVVAWVKK